jgi:hypothetical protein
MARNWTPSIVPNGEDQNCYLVVNNYGKLGPGLQRPILKMPIWKPQSAISCPANTATRFASSRLTHQNIGRRMHSGMLLGKFCAALISPGMICRHRLWHSSTCISVLTVSSLCVWPELPYAPGGIKANHPGLHRIGARDPDCQGPGRRALDTRGQVRWLLRAGSTLRTRPSGYLPGAVRTGPTASRKSRQMLGTLNAKSAITEGH